MRRLLVCALLCLPALALSKPAASKFFPYPVKCDRLPNGLQVCRVPFDSPGLVAYYTAMRVGSRNEVEPGHSGFAHFFEHMMFRGTKKVPAQQREEFVSKGGFNDNAFTSSDITVYNTFGPNDRLLDLIAIEADRFANLDYDEPAFQTEAQAVLGEYHKNAASPYRKLDEVLDDVAFTTHTYKHTTMGFYADIKKMPEYYEYSRQFFKRWYTPDNAIIFVVGDFDDAKVMQAIRTEYAQWQGKSAQVSIPTEPPQKEPRHQEILWDTPTLPRHIVAWHGPALKLDGVESATAEVLGSYLVGQTSPAYKELVLEQQLCEQIGVWADNRRDPYLFSLLAVLKTEGARAKVAEVLAREIKDLQAGKVDAKRLADIQSNTRYGFLMQLESPADVAVQLAVFTGMTGATDGLERHFQNVAKVQPADLVAFAKKYLTANNETVVTLTPKTAPAAQGGDK